MTSVQQPPPAGSGPSKDDINIAVVNWVLTIFAFFVPCLIIWLLYKDKSEWVGNHAKEALNFEITIAIAYAVAGMLVFAFFIGLLFFPIIGVAHLVFCIIGAVKASKGESYTVPIALHLLK
ncbi:MAG TPA: DUF4870 domain-containing protein [Phycisphaerae bacterium]|nr:DUF4870 domain-containing protein [Phycisphaerae bacterium]